MTKQLENHRKMNKSIFLGWLVFICFLALTFTVSQTDARKKKPNKRPPPRVRKEWRQLTPQMRQRVANAFWTLKNLTTAEGRAKYGSNFNNHDEMLLLHSCAVYDPRCDNGHFGPQFMTFHRAFLLKYELSLLSVDPGIKALPYWNAVFDSTTGKFRNNPDKYIYTDNFFGDYWTKPEDGYAVKNGLFANWPIATYTTEKYGKDSYLAADHQCVREQWFHPKPCDPNNSNSPRYLRDHEDCTPYLARNPKENDVNKQGNGLGGSFEIVYKQQDYNACINQKYIKNWMDWQNCIEFATISCQMKAQKSLSKNANFFQDSNFLSKLDDEAENGGEELKTSITELKQAIQTSAKGLPINMTCENANLMGSYLGKKNKVVLVNFFHSMVHLKNGLDLADVTTSPNDAASFTGHHSNVDRSNMIWQRRTVKTMKKKYWGYPKFSNDLSAKGRSPVTISGPFSTYDAAMCGGDNVTFSNYTLIGGPAWINGTWLDEPVNGGFGFRNLFPCKKDEIDWTGKLISCNGSESGYTHREILYWTTPDKTPYVYDNMKN